MLNTTHPGICWLKPKPVGTCLSQAVYGAEGQEFRVRVKGLRVTLQIRELVHLLLSDISGLRRAKRFARPN